jgi:mRNA interferase RelE/StbE
MSPRYRIFFSEAAQKELRKLGASAAREILPQIDKKLTADPVGYGKALSGALSGYYRLRVGGYRVVYTIVGQRVCVVVLAVGKRNEGNVDNIYAWLTGGTLETRLAPVLRKIESEDQDKDPGE